ncbi:MAG: isoprenylcysteine carboxylmethyltransferase family protein [Dehalococcoidia bacterium]|jgi:protein-S-isoprenylcysteine O-methyltransferase Ste14
MARETPSPRIRQFIVAFGIALVGVLVIDFSRSKGLLIGEPLALKALGVALIILGATVRIWCFVDLRSTWRIDHLVTSGIYGWTRNPIYLSFMVIILGAALVSHAWLGFAWAAASIVTLYQLARVEESDLEKAFGDEFVRYRTSVPRFLPRPPRNVLPSGRKTA